MTPPEFLSSLGSTPEEVITSLENMDIRGRRHHCAECIIAKALSHTFGDTFLVMPRVAFVEDPNTYKWATRYDLPEPVETVRHMFDAGELEQFNENLI